MNLATHKVIPPFIKALLKYYFLNLVLLSLLRLALFFAAKGSINEPGLWQSLQFGVQFDTVVLAYILALPFLVLSVQSWLGKQYLTLTKAMFIWLLVTEVILVFLTIADIPYFLFFTNRLSEASFQWLVTPLTIFEMLVSDKVHLWWLLAGIALTVGFTIFIKRKIRLNLFQINLQPGTFFKNALVFLLGSTLIFLGMRGRLDHPIRVGDAFHSDNDLLNQLGLNPLFVIAKSLESKARLMDDERALQLSKETLKISNSYPFSPIARAVIGKDSLASPNIVLVLMEGMSADYMGSFGNAEKLTPNLDSLFNHSLSFINAYSAGIHTNNGIFSTLYSFPAIKGIRPMSVTPTREYSGIPGVLKRKGYRNYFFTTHDKTFDNLAGFLPKNHFHRLYHAGDYPDSLELGPFGVPDDYLFNYVGKELSAKEKEGPFFATLLTTSNHGPYLLPNYFQSKQTDPAKRAVSFADWSIGNFIASVSKTSWFHNTIFVFVADHGLAVKQWPYGINLSYNHIPIFIHAPAFIKQPMKLAQYMGQIDVFPTLMGFLGYTYINNTLGSDALKQPRNAIYFSADDKLAAINDAGLFVYHYSGKEFYYPFAKQNNEAENAAFLKDQAFAQTQVSQWMFSNDKTALP